VLDCGQLIGSAEIGLLCTVGRIQDIQVLRKPTIGLISSGNELVPASTKDLPEGMIRDSNKAMLISILKENHHTEYLDLGTMRDDGESIDTSMQ
jgi:molybdopterin molybdotransferase